MRGPLRQLRPLTLVLASACGGDDSADATAQAAAEGETIVDDRLCATCHGAELSGATRPYPGTQAYPANLTPDQATGLGSWSDAEVVTAILDGTAPDGRQLCSAMPNYRSMGMTEDDAAAVVAYLRSLAPLEHEVPATVSCTAGGS